jgi:hypothetical protein
MLQGLGPLSSQPLSRRDYGSPRSETNEESLTHPNRRQRRRVSNDDHNIRERDFAKSASESVTSLHDNNSGANTSLYPTPSPAWGDRGTTTEIKGERRSLSADSKALDSDSEDELLSAVGQLSLNEDQQVRYHGKASGIYLLRNKRPRNEGGIWCVICVFFVESVSYFMQLLQEISESTRLASSPHFSTS